MEIKLNTDVLSDNNAAAMHNRKQFSNTKTLVINVMSSPGAGKTTLLAAAQSSQGPTRRTRPAP